MVARDLFPRKYLLLLCLNLAVWCLGTSLHSRHTCFVTGFLISKQAEEKKRSLWTSWKVLAVNNEAGCITEHS